MHIEEKDKKSCSIDGEIPESIIRFFENTGGHSLLIRGAAGTGKTTLALEILKHFGGEKNGKYISSRISDETLRMQFPWLSLGDTKLDGEGKPCFKRDALNRLEGLVEDGLIDGEEDHSDKIPPQMEDGTLIMEIGETLPEMEDAYSFVEENQPGNVLLIFDSIDGLSERYGIGKARLMRTIQTDLVEGSRTNVIFILEQEKNTPLDYLGDGVIDLSMGISEGRLTRYMSVEKMRGVSLDRPTTVFSLAEGKFFAPEPASERLLMNGIMSSEKDSRKGTIEKSMPLSDFMSSLLNVCSSTGGIHLVISDFSSNTLASVIETHVVESAIRKGWGTAWFPSRKSETRPEDRIDLKLAADTDGSKLRIFEMPVSPPTRFTAPLAGNDLYKEMGPTKLGTYLNKTRGPYVYVLDFPALTSVISRGDRKGVKSHLSFFLSTLVAGGHTIVGLIDDSSDFLSIVRENARTEVKVQRKSGCFILNGEKPFTANYMAFTPEGDSGRVLLNIME